MLEPDGIAILVTPDSGMTENSPGLRFTISLSILVRIQLSYIIEQTAADIEHGPDVELGDGGKPREIPAKGEGCARLKSNGN